MPKAGFSPVFGTFYWLLRDVSGYKNAAGGSVGQRMGDAAAVADDVQARVAAFQMVVYIHFHVIELDLHAVEQSVIVGGAGRHLVQGVNHFNDAVENSLGQHQTQIAGGGVQRGGDKRILHPAGGGAPAADQIAKPLHDHTAAKHIAQTGN